MLVVISAAAAVVFLIVCYHDIRQRVIPNWLSAAIACAGLLKWLAIGQLTPALWALAAAGIVLTVSAVLFMRGWVGGGDVKLAAAAVFLLGAPAALQFLLLMAVIGGVLAAGLLIVYRHRQPRPTIPYGVAIAAAAIAMLAIDRAGLGLA